VTLGALNLFATGLGSSDLAAAMITGQVWLRVPESIKVTLTGTRTAYLSAKDIALALVQAVGADGANYQALEFQGSALSSLTLEDRMVICNLGVEMDAKAAIFPSDAATHDYLASRKVGLDAPVTADMSATYSREISLDLSRLSPRVALPHAPNNVVASRRPRARRCTWSFSAHAREAACAIFTRRSRRSTAPAEKLPKAYSSSSPLRRARWRTLSVPTAHSQSSNRSARSSPKPAAAHAAARAA